MTEIQVLATPDDISKTDYTNSTNIQSFIDHDQQAQVNVRNYNHGYRNRNIKAYINGNANLYRTALLSRGGDTRLRLLAKLGNRKSQ